MNNLLGIALVLVGVLGLWQAGRMTSADRERRQRLARSPLWPAGLAARLPLPAARLVYGLVALVPIAIGVAALVR